MFEKYLNERVSKRLLKLRKKNNKTQNKLAYEFNYADSEEFYNPKKYYNGRSEISKIENGKIAKHNKALLTKNMIENYSKVFNLPYHRIIFGSDKEIESFCKFIFSRLFHDGDRWNLWYDNKKNNETAHNKTLELMLVNAKYVLCIFDYIDSNYDVVNNFNLIDPWSLSKKEMNLVNETIELVWKLIKDEFIQLFCDEFYYEKITMHKLNSRLMKWLNTNVVDQFNTIINRDFKKNDVLKIGYYVYELRRSLPPQYEPRPEKIGTLPSFKLNVESTNEFYRQRDGKYFNFVNDLTEFQKYYIEQIEFKDKY